MDELLPHRLGRPRPQAACQGHPGPPRGRLLALLLGIGLAFHKNRMWWVRGQSVSVFLAPPFPGTEHMHNQALARTVQSPPHPAEGTTHSAVKWPLNQLLLLAWGASWSRPAVVGTAMGTPCHKVRELSWGVEGGAARPRQCARPNKRSPAPAPTSWQPWTEVGPVRLAGPWPPLPRTGLW